ncbi:hypothetical protein N474_25565 [Pseudoalteromonas luteoviolacea CPMOR-2]|uniref:hypothetical protein n=1 Tax=Pseudoalteromonas luteoviolacea TaxID=43657 RepID=UPI0007B082D2|nr:hypothetical protein [Pseudoalteromonas luteoviolacea]KZN58421.1 hypothetical protein N474_25565 [Pseudoalteromonas luteoviolacea CPMOR-2]
MNKFFLFFSSFIFFSFLFGSEFYIHKYTNEALRIKNKADNYVVATGAARQVFKDKKSQYNSCIKRYSKQHDACIKIDVLYWEQAYKTQEKRAENEQERYLFSQERANTYASIQRMGCATSIMAFLILFIFIFVRR